MPKPKESSSIYQRRGLKRGRQGPSPLRWDGGVAPKRHLCLFPPLSVSNHYLGTCKTFSRAQWPKEHIIMWTDSTPGLTPHPDILVFLPVDRIIPWTGIYLWITQRQQGAHLPLWGQPWDAWPGMLKHVALLVCYKQNLRRGTPKGPAVDLMDIQVASSHEASTSWSIRNLLSSLTCMLCGAGSISRVVSVDHLVYKTLCNAVQVLRKCSYSILETSDRCLA